MVDKNNCSHAKDSLLEEIQEGLSPEGFELFLDKHADCKEELEVFYATIQELDELDKPLPSDEMDAGFYELLDQELEQKSPLKIKKNNSWIKNFAVAASIFIVGVLAGFYLMQQEDKTQLLVSEIDKDDNVILTSNSSINRLNDISEMKKAPELNDKIINALNLALIKDPNVNVRLSAIEAMLHYADNPKVRENLIKAIPYQKSPIIQLTLAEVMINLSAGNSKDQWEELFRSEDLEADVKLQLEETLAPVLKL